MKISINNYLVQPFHTPLALIETNLIFSSFRRVQFRITRANLDFVSKQLSSAITTRWMTKAHSKTFFS